MHDHVATGHRRPSRPPSRAPRSHVDRAVAVGDRSRSRMPARTRARRCRRTARAPMSNSPRQSVSSRTVHQHREPETEPYVLRRAVGEHDATELGAPRAASTRAGASSSGWNTGSATVEPRTRRRLYGRNARGVDAVPRQVASCCSTVGAESRVREQRGALHQQACRKYASPAGARSFHPAK